MDAATTTGSFERRRGEVGTYFDRTASTAWARLTSTEPLGRIRTTVRAGRDRMREAILAFLPPALEHTTILDAGSGTGAMAERLAARGAAVIAVELSPTLSDLARARIQTTEPGSIRFEVGDMTDPALGAFDHIVAMDCLIHYDLPDVVRVLAGLSARTSRSIVFTFAPGTPLLSSMHAVGKLFPRSDRSPAIIPTAERRLRAAIAAAPALNTWRIARTTRIASGFYTSQAMELVRA